MIGVAGGSPAAVAALPLRARSVADPAGAIVIVDGTRGWPERSLRALHAGAAALVLVDPIAVDDDDAAALAEAAGRTPIVLDRPWLRADLVLDATPAEPARQVTADVVAAPAELHAATRDAIGWLRVLAGGDLELRAAATVTQGLLALFEDPTSGRAAAVTAFALAGRGGLRLRAQAIGEARIEVDLDAVTGARSIDSISADGVQRKPRRHESGGRLALRRAIDAVVQSAMTSDLADFRHDCRLAAQAWEANKRG